MKKKYLLLSFSIPFFFYFFCQLLINDNINYISYLNDTVNQYIPLFKYLNYIYSFDNSILYNFSLGLGGNSFMTYFYYLSSPLNCLIIFFKDINLFINVIVLIKIGLCGLFMNIYLNSKSNKSLFSNFIFSLCYALMGYNICYIGNIFWIDVVYITPIVLMGIDRIISKNSIILFILSFSYALFCNFYISFSLFLFCIIYLVYNLMFVTNINKKKIIINYLFSIFISIGLCSIFLVPVGFQLLQFKERLDIKSFINSDYKHIFYIFYKHLIGSNNLNFNDYIFQDSPNLYCSIFVLLLYIFYFFNKNISKKEKTFVLLINIFFILSMVFEPFYLLWHCFGYTNGYSYRFSFLWILFILLISYKSFLLFDKKILYERKLYLFIFLFFYFIFVLYFNNSVFYNSGLEIIFSFIFVCVYLLLLNYKKYFVVFFVVIIEVFLNLLLSIHFEYNNSFDYDNICKKSTYYGDRVLTDFVNESISCNYGSSTFYLSSINNNLVSFLSNSGGSAYKIHSYGYYDSILIDSLLGIKYDDVYPYLNENYVLSYGYMVYKKDFKYTNSIEFQENLLNNMTGLSNVYFVSFPFEFVENYDFKFENNYGDKYILFDFDDYRVGKIYVNEKRILKNTFPIFNHLIFLNDLKDSENIINFDLLCSDEDDICSKLDLELYDFDYNSFEEAINVLKEQQLNVTKIYKNTLEGNIEVTKDDQYLFLSIPYEKGWNIYVDGKKVNYEKIYDAFIGVKLDKGYHEIKMVFYPYGINIGIIISSISIFILIFYSKHQKKV